jgi:DNA-binding CsgD family transcriptional regulator
MQNKSLDWQKALKEKIKLISSVADDIPAVVIIHDLPDLNVLFMSNFGLKLLDVTWSQIRTMGRDEFQRTFFNDDDARESTPKIMEMLSKNADDFVSYFQQVRTSKTREWDWYMSMTKVLTRDDNGTPASIVTIAMQIDPEHEFTAKAGRLLEENVFLRTHYHLFATLTNREREILKLLASGRSAVQIARQLNITKATAETHRKKVREKLQARNSFQLVQYATAFSLI